MDDVAVLEADLGEGAADLGTQLRRSTAENWPRNSRLPSTSRCSGGLTVTKGGVGAIVRLGVCTKTPRAQKKAPARMITMSAKPAQIVKRWCLEAWRLGSTFE